MLNKISVLAVLVFTPFLVQAASVWKVSKNGSSLYIGGTVHILNESDYPLPKAYDDAFKDSKLLVLETDMATVQSAAFQQQFMLKGLYQDGKTIKDVLSADTFMALEQHLKERGIPVNHFLTMKPGMLSVTLSVMEMQRLGITSEGVDYFYADKAAAENMPQQFLETPEQQLQFIVDMGQDNPDRLIHHTLQDTKNLGDMMKDIIAHWRKGDMQALAKLTLTDFKTDYPGVYQRILIDRNNDWIPKIEALFATAQKELVLVGALHLAGEDSVLAKLRAKGYKVEKY